MKNIILLIIAGVIAGLIIGGVAVYLFFPQEVEKVVTVTEIKEVEVIKEIPKTIERNTETYYYVYGDTYRKEGEVTEQDSYLRVEEKTAKDGTERIRVCEGINPHKLICHYEEI